MLPFYPFGLPERRQRRSIGSTLKWGRNLARASEDACCPTKLDGAVCLLTSDERWSYALWLYFGGPSSAYSISCCPRDDARDAVYGNENGGLGEVCCDNLFFCLFSFIRFPLAEREFRFCPFIFAGLKTRRRADETRIFGLGFRILLV